MISITDIRIRPKILLILFFVSVLPLVLFSLYFGYLSKESLLESSFEKLVTVKKIKADELEERFRIFSNDAKSLAANTDIQGLVRLQNILSNNDYEKLSQMLRKNNHHFDGFLEGKKEQFVKYLEASNYRDIYIVDPVVGNIMYSVHDVKSRGLNVLTGKFKNAMLGKTWQKAIKENRPTWSDFDVMSAEDHSQVAFMASPIVNTQGQTEALLMLCFDAKIITGFMGSREGLGETGESYIIGWQEKTDTYELRSALSDKYSTHKSIGSSLPATKLWKAAVKKGFDGGHGIFTDVLGNKVLAQYSQVDLAGLNWFLIAKIDENEVLVPLTRTYQKIIVFAICFVVLISCFGILIAWSFTRPIVAEMNFADAIAHGNFDGELDVDRKDEIGDLAHSLRNMSQQLFAVDWIRRKQEDLDNLLRGNQEIDAISQDCINFFVQNLSASLGAIYLNNSGVLELKASHSFSDRKGNFTSFAMGEGLVGQAGLENEVLYFSKIVDGPSFNYGMGEEEMNFFVAAPLTKDREVIAVILLGAYQEFSDLEDKFIRQNVDNLAILFTAAKSRESISKLLKRSQQQQIELQKSNEQLEEQKLDLQSAAAELQAQQEELRVTNDELAEQTKALQASEEELQAEQEELRVTNEELATKSTDLENQQKTIAAKNSELEKAKVEVERRMVEVERASKYKSEFLSNMSHELRTPLNSILILSQLLGQNKTGNLTDKQATSANAINASGADLLKLINEILDLSKIESGKLELNVEKLTFKKIEDDLNRLYSEMATQKGLSFIVNKDQSLPAEFVSDNQRFQQIIRNLVSNAIKFTSKGEVSVGMHLATSDQLQSTALEGKEALCFSVKDDGIGIPKDKQADVFMAFQQADGSTSRKFGGTGLGLSISKELTKLLGGFLALDSAENVGSTFSIFIPIIYDGANELSTTVVNSQVVKTVNTVKPIAQVGVAKESSQTKVNQAEQSLLSEVAPLLAADQYIPDDRKNITPESKSLLIIEDDNSFAKVMIDFGRERGFACVHASDGETGLHFADYYLPSAIVLDIGLPGISGWDVMARLKENRRLRHIPVHFISAEDSPMEALRMGAVGFLTKPISIEKIEETLGKFEHLNSGAVPKLLLVEDDKLQQDSIKELIGENYVDITAVGTGVEAYNLLVETSYDCIILDLGLRDMSGFELLEQIRANESLQQTPVIIYTGKDLSRDEESKLSKYADSIIIKGAKSPERLFDETALFLHCVEADLPEEKQKMLNQLCCDESILSDITLLIVDDDMRNIFALTSILEDRDIDVIIARDGLEALQKLEENIDVIDGVLMDIMMPNMDGYEAMTKIRKEMKLTKLPMIALTAKAMKDDRMKCIDAGANDYLAKPIITEKLISMLKVWLYK